MIKTSVILFVLFYLVTAHSQQTIDKLNSNQLKLPKETISKALSIDATGQVKSSATSDTELGYLSGVTSAIQNQIDDKANDADAVHLTGDESISGVKTLTGKLVTSSTVNASIPCPVMTQTQRDAIVSPVTGDCVFNSNTSLSNIYDGAIWKAMGGSGGGISLWVTANGYAIDDVVIESNKIYICLIAHTSGTFATDLVALKWLRVSTDVTGATGLLPLATGGTNKSITASSGSVVYSDADSFELLSGTSGQTLQSNGSSAPSFVNKSISGKAQNKTAVTSEEIQFPNNLLTETGTNKYLSESGNKNILDNPSFEHSTFSTGWTNSAGTFTQETSVVIDGKASAKLVLSAQTMSLTQSSTLYAAQFADGVQGLAMVRIKSDIALKVCSIQAGTVSTTNCVMTNTDSKWALYKIPFILGATSNGVSIASSGIVTGTVYVDDAFVGSVDLKQDIASFATILNAEGNGGTSVTANVTNITFNEITDTTNSWNGTTFTIPETGTYAITAGVQFTTAASRYIAIYINGTVYRTMSDVSVTTPFNKGDYVGKFTKGDIISIRSSGSSTLTNVVDHFLTISQSTASSVYSSQCGANCVDTFSAKFSSAGVVSEESIEWITGDANAAGSGIYNTINFNSGLFTVAPNCTCMSNAGGVRACSVASTSSSILGTVTTAVNGSAANAGFNIICQKQGKDFVATRNIIGSFNEVVTSPGISKPKVCEYNFGGAASTMASPVECTTGTCVEMYDSCGTGSPPAWSTVAFYEHTVFAAGTFANSSPVKCSCEAFDVTANATRDCNLYKSGSSNVGLTDASGGLTLAARTTDGSATAATTHVAIICKGQAP